MQLILQQVSFDTTVNFLLSLCALLGRHTDNCWHKQLLLKASVGHSNCSNTTQLHFICTEVNNFIHL